MNIFRTHHVKPGNGYSCIHCKKTMNDWRNYQRHMKESHGNSTLFPCSYCPFKTKRRHDLGGHVKRIHSRGINISCSLLIEILSDVCENVGLCGGFNLLDEGKVVNVIEDRVTSETDVDVDDMTPENAYDLASSTGEEDIVSENQIVESDTVTVSPYEQIRIDNMAEIRAMFLIAFPEKAEVKKAPVIKKKKNEIWKELPSRKSSRINAKTSEELAANTSEIHNGINDDSNGRNNYELVVSDNDYSNDDNDMTDDSMTSSISVSACVSVSDVSISTIANFDHDIMGSE